MKKLLMAVGVAMLGLATQAAVATWEAADIYTFVSPTEVSNVLASDYLVYYIDAGNYSYASAQTALAKGDISFVGTYGAQGTYDGDGATLTDTPDWYSDGQSFDAYVVILNTSESLSTATYAYLSGLESGTIGEQGQTPYLAFDTSSSADGANWTAVPEPTSGLLLLVGGALLALKRRRA